MAFRTTEHTEEHGIFSGLENPAFDLRARVAADDDQPFLKQLVAFRVLPRFQWFKELIEQVPTRPSVRSGHAGLSVER
jgi:hypothetical protein